MSQRRHSSSPRFSKDASITLPPIRHLSAVPTNELMRLSVAGQSLTGEFHGTTRPEKEFLPDGTATIRTGRAKYLATRLWNRPSHDVRGVSESLDRFFECFAAHHAITDPISGRFHLSPMEHEQIVALLRNMVSEYENGLIPVEELQSESLASRWSFLTKNVVSESACQRIIHLAQVSAVNGYVNGEEFMTRIFKVDEPKWRKRLISSFWKLVAVVVYYVLGCLFYQYVDDFSFIDSIYFITVSVTTVGYGDIVPKTDLSRMVTVFYIFVGLVLVVGIIIGEISDMIDSYQDRIKEVGKGILLITDSEKRKLKILSLYALHILFAILLVSLPLLSGMVVMYYTAPERDGMSFMTSFYWASMSSFSIGYGDFVPDGEWNKLWVTGYLFGAVACVTAAIAQIGTLKLTITTYKRLDLLNNSQLAISLIAQLDSGKGSGVDKFEFLAAMLVSLEKVTTSDIADIISLFNLLNSDGTSRDQLDSGAQSPKYSRRSPRSSRLTLRQVLRNRDRRRLKEKGGGSQQEEYVEPSDEKVPAIDMLFRPLDGTAARRFDDPNSPSV